MRIQTALTERLDLAYPIIQAPMAGSDTAALAGAVSAAGALGSLGAAYLTPEQIIERARQVRAITDRPFGINLFAPTAVDALPPDADEAVERIAPYYAELGLPRPPMPGRVVDQFDAQVEAVLQTEAAVFSVTFGMIPAPWMPRLKQRMFVLGSATCVEEAVALANAGVDGIVAQGSEAGGHRGTFATSFERGMVGTMALVPQIVDAVAIPVIAAGGIMDGRGIAAALALGAAAAQLGTAFLTCHESGAIDGYKQRVLAARDVDTRITRAFSGRAARGLVNRVMEEVDAAGAILPFPLQNALTRPMRNAAARKGDPDYLSLWAGQAAHLARRMPATRLIEELAAETEIAITRLARPAAEDD